MPLPAILIPFTLKAIETKLFSMALPIALKHAGAVHTLYTLYPKAKFVYSIAIPAPVQISILKAFGFTTFEAYKLMPLFAGSVATWGAIFDKMDKIKKMNAADEPK